MEERLIPETDEWNDVRQLIRVRTETPAAATQPVKLMGAVCLYCNASLGLERRLRQHRFCSVEHEELFRDQQTAQFLKRLRAESQPQRSGRIWNDRWIAGCAGLRALRVESAGAAVSEVPFPEGASLHALVGPWTELLALPKMRPTVAPGELPPVGLLEWHEGVEGAPRWADVHCGLPVLVAASPSVPAYRNAPLSGTRVLRPSEYIFRVVANEPGPAPVLSLPAYQSAVRFLRSSSELLAGLQAVLDPAGIEGAVENATVAPAEEYLPVLQEAWSTDERHTADEVVSPARAEPPSAPATPAFTKVDWEAGRQWFQSTWRLPGPKRVRPAGQALPPRCERAPEIFVVDRKPASEWMSAFRLRTPPVRRGNGGACVVAGEASVWTEPVEVQPAVRWLCEGSLRLIRSVPAHSAAMTEIGNWPKNIRVLY